MKMRRVNHIGEITTPGDYTILTHGPGGKEVIMSCECGIMFNPGGTIMSENPLTIMADNQLIKCPNRHKLYVANGSLLKI